MYRKMYVFIIIINVNYDVLLVYDMSVKIQKLSELLS